MLPIIASNYLQFSDLYATSTSRVDIRVADLNI